MIARRAPSKFRPDRPRALERILLPLDSTRGAGQGSRVAPPSRGVSRRGRTGRDTCAVPVPMHPRSELRSPARVMCSTRLACVRSRPGWQVWSAAKVIRCGQLRRVFGRRGRKNVASGFVNLSKVNFRMMNRHRRRRSNVASGGKAPGAGLAREERGCVFF